MKWTDATMIDMIKIDNQRRWRLGFQQCFVGHDGYDVVDTMMSSAQFDDVNGRDEEWLGAWPMKIVKVWLINSID